MHKAIIIRKNNCGDLMGIIQCAEECKYQLDGYCSLEKPTTVNSLDGGCPYKIEKLFNNSKRFAETSHTDKL